MLNDSHQRRYQRREKAALRGDHLPDEEELLGGMCFLSDDMHNDVAEYARRLALRIRRRRREGFEALLAELDELTLGATEDALLGVIAEVEGLPKQSLLQPGTVRLRCRIYLSWLGHPEATAMVAAVMAKMAFDKGKSDKSEARDLAFGALGCAILANKFDLIHGDGGFRPFVKMRTRKEAENYSTVFRSLLSLVDTPEANKEEAFELDLAPEVDAEPEKAEDGSEDALRGIVVFPKIGNASTSAGKQVEKEFGGLIGSELPTAAVHDTAAVRSRLLGEFPYTLQVVDALLEPLTAQKGIRFRPSVLIGSPGSGKTRFARRLAEELGLPWEIVSCGGMADSSLGGTPRQWHTGQPSLPVMVVRHCRNAGPVIILDEVEKTGDRRHNGRLHDVLLGLLEPESARRWMDPYLMAQCDLSHVSWLMTANEPDPIPQPLRDRIRFLRFPDPRPEDLAALAERMLKSHCADLGIDARWALPLDGAELEALSAAWPGGSLRILRRLVEGVWRAREADRGTH